MIQSFGSGLGHAASTWKRGMSSANAGLAMMAARSSEKDNLTTSSLRSLAVSGFMVRGRSAPAWGPQPGRCYTVLPGSRTQANHQIILQSLTVALWHALTALPASLATDP